MVNGTEKTRFLPVGIMVFTLILMTIPTPAKTQQWEDDSLSYASIMEKTDDILGMEEELSEAADSGKKKSIVCAQCHGLNGNSTYPWVPNLAGQNATYLINQLFYFATGIRKDFVMTGLAETLSEEDIIDLSIFYSQLQVNRHEPQTLELIAAGANAYVRQCQRCHGVQALGKEQFPRLAGQQFEYLRNSLKRFRAKTSNRVGSEMVSVLSELPPLSDAQVDALSAYLSAIHK